jgi:hypothetical protein
MEECGRSGGVSAVGRDVDATLRPTDLPLQFRDMQPRVFC